MTDDHDPPPASKLTRSKERWAREGRFLTGKISRPEDQRLPPGQHLTRDWPTLDLGLTPNISRAATPRVSGRCYASPGEPRGPKRRGLSSRENARAD